MSRGPETEKHHLTRIASGFYETYMSGHGLDIGPNGDGLTKGIPVLHSATGVDLNYPGYNGLVLPFPDKSQDYVYSSHVLEHIYSFDVALLDWFRVTKVGGHLIIIVPHRDLYEKKWVPPSQWNADHKRFYTPFSLLGEVERVLPMPNHFRVAHLRDNDDNYDYTIPQDKHAHGGYEIELVIKRIK